MSRGDVEVSVVPADCTPGWRDLPALAWVAARAYCPGWAPVPLARVLAACSLLVWLLGMASLRRRGQLAAVGRSAVVGVQRLKNPRALMWVLGAMVLLLIGGSVLIWHWLGASMYLAALVLVTPCWLPLLMLRPWRVIRSQQAIERVYAGLQASDPGAAILQLGALAAWPRRERHGSALVGALLAASSVDGFVVAYPGSSALRDWYLRLGMLEHADGALYLDLRKGSLSYSSSP
jgi:hypothetical protein